MNIVQKLFIFILLKSFCFSLDLKSAFLWVIFKIGRVHKNTIKHYSLNIFFCIEEIPFRRIMTLHALEIELTLVNRIIHLFSCKFKLIQLFDQHGGEIHHLEKEKIKTGLSSDVLNTEYIPPERKDSFLSRTLRLFFGGVGVFCLVSWFFLGIFSANKIF